jgi:hypothetical protein
VLGRTASSGTETVLKGLPKIPSLSPMAFLNCSLGLLRQEGKCSGRGSSYLYLHLVSLLVPAFGCGCLLYAVVWEVTAFGQNGGLVVVLKGVLTKLLTASPALQWTTGTPNKHLSIYSGPE